jgi:hypothetical protein
MVPQIDSPTDFYVRLVTTTRLLRLRRRLVRGFFHFTCRPLLDTADDASVRRTQRQALCYVRVACGGGGGGGAVAATANVVGLLVIDKKPARTTGWRHQSSLVVNANLSLQLMRR